MPIALACGNLNSHLGTGDGGSRSDGGSDAGADGGSQGSSDSGVPTDGGADAGSPGDAGGLTWSFLTSPSTNKLDSIAGLGSTLYVGDDNGSIFYGSGTPGSWSTAYNQSNSVISLWVAPSGAVFAAAGSALISCSSGCTQASAFTSQTVAIDSTGVCGSDASHVYAVGNATGVGALYQWTAGTWTALVSDTGSNNNAACWVASSGDVFIAAQSQMLRWNGTGIQPETMNWPSSWGSGDIANMNFNAVGGGNDGLFYAAGASQRVFQRSTAGTWSMAFGSLTQIVGYLDAVAFPAGGPGLAAGYNPDAVLWGSSWVQDPNAPAMNVLGLWTPGGRTIYAVGESNDGMGTPMMAEATY